jgi:hypothetical protein
MLQFWIRREHEHLDEKGQWRACLAALAARDFRRRSTFQQHFILYAIRSPPRVCLPLSSDQNEASHYARDSQPRKLFQNIRSTIDVPIRLSPNSLNPHRERKEQALTIQVIQNPDD